MEEVRLVDLVDQWLALDKYLLQYRVGHMPFGFSTNELKFIECRICWHNMGWIGGDRIVSNFRVYEASNPSFFKDLRMFLIKHTKKCKIQKY